MFAHGNATDNMWQWLEWVIAYSDKLCFAVFAHDRIGILMRDDCCSFIRGVGRAMFCAAVLCLVLLLAGCRPTDPAKDVEPRKSSTVELLSDGVTGKYAVDAGKRAKADIEVIAEQQNARLEALFEE